MSTEDVHVQELWMAQAERCRRRLHTFVREAWSLVEPRPFVDNWHIGAICEHLQAVTEGEIRKLIINVPPRSTKSLTTAVFWPAWEWLFAPEVRWVFASYADTLATKHSLICRRLMQTRALATAVEGVPWIRRVGYRGLLEFLGEDWDFTADQVLKTRFENNRAGYRNATSVGGTATGEGGDRLVIDDPLKAEDALSDLRRKGANEWFDGTWSTRLNDPVRSTHVVIMQRLHEEDLTGHLLERGGWEHLCLPGEFESAHPFTWPADPRTVEGETLDPVRLPPARLVELKRDLGSYGYAGQIQQRPAPAEGGMFKRAWWKRWRPEALPPQWSQVIASWDMAFKATDGSSYVVGQVWASDGADRYLIGQVRARLEFTRIVRRGGRAGGVEARGAREARRGQGERAGGDQRAQAADHGVDPDRARWFEGGARRRGVADRRGRERVSAGGGVHPVPSGLRGDVGRGLHRGARQLPRSGPQRHGGHDQPGAQLARGPRRPVVVDRAGHALQRSGDRGHRTRRADVDRRAVPGSR